MLGGGTSSAIGRTHAIAMRMDGALDLVGGCFSRDPGTNAASGRSHGVTADRVHPDLATLLGAERDRADVLVVATPIEQHAAQISTALRAGWTVVTDKPLAHTSAAAEELVAAGSTTGTRRLFTIFNYTGYPALRELRARLRRGDLGRVVRVMAEMPQDSYLRLVNSGDTGGVQEWRRRDGRIATVTLDLFVHVHSLVRFLTPGRPVRVSAWSRSVAGLAPGLVDDVDARIEHDDGMVVSTWYGKAALGAANGLRLRVYGERGAADWRQDRPEELVLHDRRSRTTVLDRGTMDARITPGGEYDRFKPGHPSGFIEAFANCYADVAAAVRGDDAPDLLPDGAAVEGLRVAEAITDSAGLGGAPVPVDVGASSA